MTTRSFDSLASGQRRQERVTDEDVYHYALRVSYLSYLMQPKAPERTNGAAPKEAEPVRDRDHFRLSGMANSLYSIGDLFKDLGRDGNKSVKFPEKLLKVLENKLRDIAMGKDAGYTDQLTRRTVAVFWSSLKEPAFHRQMKENRKIEELILMFVTTATAALKKDPQLSGDGWKAELENQIANFVRILRDSLQSVSHVPPELTARLEMYSAKLVPQTAPPATPTRESVAGPSTRTADAYTTAPRLQDMPLVHTVGTLFGVPDQDVLKDIKEMKNYCTEKAALLDLKTIWKNIHDGVSFPRQEDFDSEAAYNYWRTRELGQISQHMVMMVQLNQSLAKPAPSQVSRPDSLYDRPAASRTPSISGRQSLSIPTAEHVTDTIQNDDEVNSSNTYTYIPPNPRKYHRHLLEVCLEYDIHAMKSLPEDQEVSLSILSSPHRAVLEECALRWRVQETFCLTCHLDVIRYKEEREGLPLACLHDAILAITKQPAEEREKWPRQDLEFLAQVFHKIFNDILGRFYGSLDRLAGLKYEHIAPFIEILEEIMRTGLLESYNIDVNGQIAVLADPIRTAAMHEYTDKKHDEFSQPGVNRALPLLFMTDYLEKQAKLLEKRFPEPLLGQIDMPALALEVLIPMFFTDIKDAQRSLLEGSMNQPTPDVPIEDIFTLYRRTKVMLKLYSAYCPNSITDFEIDAFFEPYIRQWLINTDNKTSQWVKAAISADKFEPDGPQKNSSSIVDVFGSLKSPIDFLLDLEWPDQYQEARFFTSLSKTISKSIQEYCKSIEELFMEEMFPRSAELTQPQKQNAWIEKAKQAVQTEKKVDPFIFQPSSCIKFNNIEAARTLLDQMYARLEADRIAETINAHGPSVPNKSEKQANLFTVKVVCAEGLVPNDSNPWATLDTFVSLSDEHGNRMAKTRTIYESLDPRWEETFDISADSALWIVANVCDRALVGKHDIIGRAPVCLDPRQFGDFLTHDIWLGLDSAGRILLRISMEGEKDDIQFYFGRAFRSLKRTEGDMGRVFVDKMAPMINQSLSRNVLKVLVKPSGTGVTAVVGNLDYNKALGNMTAFYRNAMGNTAGDVQIPLPPSDKPTRPRGEGGLTDIEIEEPLAPLFNYLTENLRVFDSSLSKTAQEMIINRVWKEILLVLEGLLVPPLSDVPSDLKPLSEREVDIVFKWLKFLRDYFYDGGEGFPLESLQNQKYRDIVSIRLYYDWHTDALMEECVRMMQQNLRSAHPTGTKRAKSVYASKNLGTIKDRKREKREKKESKDSGWETIMRILRMRKGTSDFLSHQLQVMAQITQQQQAKPPPSNRRIGGGGRRGGQQADLPPLPPLPS